MDVLQVGGIEDHIGKMTEIMKNMRSEMRQGQKKISYDPKGEITGLRLEVKQ